MGVTCIRLDEENEERLENLAAKLNRSKNFLINRAISEYIVRQSADDARWEDTLAALDSVKAGETVGESEVVSWLKSWGKENELSSPTK